MFQILFHVKMKLGELLTKVSHKLDLPFCKMKIASPSLLTNYEELTNLMKYHL